ncbi:MAG: redoxin family protein [Planctomycetota bacterium]
MSWLRHSLVCLLLITACVFARPTLAVDHVAERFAEYDSNSDGILTTTELTSSKAFKALDTDGDGKINLDEARSAVETGKLDGIELPDPVPAATDKRKSVETEIRQGPKPVKASDIGVGRQISNLTFTDIKGRQKNFDQLLKESKLLVVAMTGTGCPLCQKYAPTIAAIEEQYKTREVAFVFVNPNESEDTERLTNAIQTHGFDGHYVHCVDEALTQALDVKTTTEVFVIDSARTLVYRGAVDDQYGFGYILDEPRHRYLTDAIQAVLAGDRPPVSATTSPGCEMFYQTDTPERSLAVTYHNRISRILQNSCLECHRDGGLAPFALQDYESVQDYAGMIASVVRRGVMPPWFAGEREDSNFEVRWVNDCSLAAKDKADLLAWIEGGAPEGNPADAPLPRKFPEGWEIGEPDVVLQIPRSVAIKATGQMPYVHQVVETNFDEDRWIQAVEVRPTASAVVHHVLVFVQDGKRRSRSIDEDAGFLAAYVPGNTHQQYPDGMAKRIPAGSRLIFQLHYTPNGTATNDQTKLGLRFSDKPPTRVIRNTGISNHNIKIPSGAANHPEKASMSVPMDVRVLSLMPHMHVRGKAFRYDVTLPDGQKKRLLDVPRFDFNWQLEYRLANPLDLPRGSTIELTGWYDNSEDNPANPDPNKTVRWGPQTDDEMMLGYVEYYVTTETADQVTERTEADEPAEPSNRWTQLFRRADADGDGKVTRSEYPKRRIFDRLDINSDDVITLEELLKAGPEL